MINKIKQFFEGNQRSAKAKKNILGSIFLKGCSILISFVLVPLTLGYLNPFEYGIWLTLSSILMWINYFDVGLGNGLRNKLTEALALDNKPLANIYVSTTFFLLTSFIVVVYILFLVAQFWLDWAKILNVPSDLILNLNSLVSIVFLFFCLSFVLKFIGNIYLATQSPVINDLLTTLGSIVSLVIIFVLTKTTSGDLSKVAITYSIAPVIVYLIAYPVTFYIKYPFLRPSFKSIKIKYTKDLMGLGLQFFVIQIACLIIFSTSNILISNLFGPEQVTPYNIAYKYFMTITMAFGIIISPIWSAITDAYVKDEYEWIKKTGRNIQYIWIILLIMTILMVVLSNFIYSIWVGDEVEIPLSLSILMALYVTINNWNNIYAYFVNGVGKIRLQLYAAIISSIIFIPLAIFCSKIWGVNGILITMCVVLFLSGSFYPFQYKKIIHKNAKGIWNK